MFGSSSKKNATNIKSKLISCRGFGVDATFCGWRIRKVCVWGKWFSLCGDLSTEHYTSKCLYLALDSNSTGLTSNRSCKVRSTAAKRTERPWHASCWAERWVPQGDRRGPLSSPGSSLSGLSQHINRSFLHKVVGLWDKCSVGAQGGGRKSHLEVRKDGQRWHCVGCWSWSTQLSRIITFAKSNMGTVTLQRHDI